MDELSLTSSLEENQQWRKTLSALNVPEEGEPTQNELEGVAHEDFSVDSKEKFWGNGAPLGSGPAFDEENSASLSFSFEGDEGEREEEDEVDDPDADTGTATRTAGTRSGAGTRTENSKEKPASRKNSTRKSSTTSASRSTPQQTQSTKTSRKSVLKARSIDERRRESRGSVQNSAGTGTATLRNYEVIIDDDIMSEVSDVTVPIDVMGFQEDGKEEEATTGVKKVDKKDLRVSTVERINSAESTRSYQNQSQSMTYNPISSVSVMYSQQKSDRYFWIFFSSKST